jgi:phosphoribosyl 1,2-cyclic phosphate phosphodiesterase
MDGKRYLIDVGPDFRAQALGAKIDHLDGVLITHAHSDHIAGIDDLRAYYFIDEKKVPCLCSKETYDEIAQRFPYLMRSEPGGSISAQIAFQVLESDFGECLFAGVKVGYLTYFQMKMKVTGFRFADFAYVSDIRHFETQVYDALQGVEVLVLSALRHESTEMHFGIPEAIEFSRHVKAKRTYFTHIAHDIDHEKVYSQLPPGFYLGYDGLSIPIGDIA